MPRRRRDKVDGNQSEIVSKLRQIPGVTVEVGHDDILVGYNSKTFWFEIKDPSTVSAKTGEIKESEKKPDQKRLEREWRGHYRIVHCIDQILDDLSGFEGEE